MTFPKFAVGRLFPILIVLASIHSGAFALLAGDVDKSGVVNESDLNIVVNAVLGGAPTIATDLDANGVTDAVDYQLLVRVLLGQDIDADDDGLSDEAEENLGTDPGDADSDDDGLNDGDEVFTHETDPNDSDTDNDDLNDGDEVNTHGTEPKNPDSDGDGIDDGDEILAGTDPNVADVFPIINEFMASNVSSLQDEDGNFSDWIEVYNPHDESLNLMGWGLTDNAGVPGKWTFPSVTLPAGGYLVVFASGLNRRPLGGGELHTNFSLNADGEFLGLSGPGSATVRQSFDPEYPGQSADVSYGLYNDGLLFFTVPTPGGPNDPTNSFSGTVADTKFTMGRGIYDAPFEVAITTATEGAEIWYTLDGTPPAPDNGTRYTAPVFIGGTTTLRAAGFRAGWRPTNVDTQTYIFPNDIIEQDYQATLDRGFPTSWDGTSPDYGMDPDVIDQNGGDLFGGQYADLIHASLRDLPTFSIVMDLDDMFGSQGIYSHPGSSGSNWERPASLEMIYADGTEGFQIDAGLRIQGGAFRGFGLTRKKSFRFLFKSEYGSGKLNYPLFGDSAVDEFDTITLRMDSNDGYSWGGHSEVQYARDEFSRQSQLALGQPGSHGMRVHLYINGAYWGIYNPVERPDSSFGAAYFGAEREAWDGINSGDPPGTGNVINSEGDNDRKNRAITNWNAMVDLTEAVDNAADESTRTALYQQLQGNNPDGTRNPSYPVWLDMDHMIAYFMVNYYGGNSDWPRKNYYTGRDSGPDSTGWKFFCWDSEWSLHMQSDLNKNVTSSAAGVALPFQNMRASEEFRLRFADKVHEAFFNEGIFFVGAERNVVLERYLAITDAVALPLVAESARWGDMHRSLPYTVEAEWRNELTYLSNTYFPQRSAIVLNQFRSGQLYPSVAAPVFYIDGTYQHGGDIDADAELTMIADSEGGGGGGGGGGGSGGLGGPIVWSDAETVLSVNDIDLSGTLVDARDLGPNSGSTNVTVGAETITFQTMDYQNITEGGHTQQSEMFIEPVGFDANFAAVLDGFSYDGDNPKVLTLTGLVEDAVYQIQLFVSDDRGCCNGRTMEFQDPEGNTSDSFDAGDSVQVIGVFTAEGTAQTIELHGLGQSQTNLNAYVLRQLPAAKGNKQNGVIYYTLDGSDPRLQGGAVSPSALVYNEAAPPVLNSSVQVRARTLEAGEWSALNDATYARADLGGALRITEIMYHPADSGPGVDGPEFIEIQNISGSAVDLSLVAFNEGIHYTFPGGLLAAGAFAVLTDDMAAFEVRYGAGIASGVYEGKLANGGEWIGLADAAGQIIVRLDFADDWWPSTDGPGHSLTAVNPALADPAAWSTKEAWLPSTNVQGSPGAADGGALP